MRRAGSNAYLLRLKVIVLFLLYRNQASHMLCSGTAGMRAAKEEERRGAMELWDIRIKRRKKKLN